MKIEEHPVRNRRILTFLAFLTVACTVVAAQDNPFTGMASRSYSDYCFDLDRIAYIDIGKRDSLSAAQTVKQMREAAEVTKHRKWSLEADLLEETYRF